MNGIRTSTVVIEVLVIVMMVFLFVAMAAGSQYVLDSDGKMWRIDGEERELVPLTPKCRYVLDVGGSMWHSTGEKWEPVPAEPKCRYVVDIDGNMQHSTGEKWEAVSTKPKGRCILDIDGNLWHTSGEKWEGPFVPEPKCLYVGDIDGNMWHSTGEKWEPVSPSPKCQYVKGVRDGMWHATGEKWEPVSPSPGYRYVMDIHGNMWHSTGEKWGGPVSPSPKCRYVMDIDGDMWHSTGEEWEPVSPEPKCRYVRDIHDQMWHATGEKWEPVSPSPKCRYVRDIHDQMWHATGEKWEPVSPEPKCRYVMDIDGKMWHAEGIEGTGDRWTPVEPQLCKYIRTLDGIMWHGTGKGWEIVEAEVEVDEFPDSWAEITLSLPPILNEEVITFTGPTTVEVYFEEAEGAASDTDGDGRDQVVTQMVEMTLTGESKLLGPLAMRLRGTTYGEIEETEDAGGIPGTTNGVLDLPPFTDSGTLTAFSFFDVLFEVELLDPPAFIEWFAPNLVLLHNEEPVHMTATIDHKPPPAGATYKGDPVDLFDEDGNAVTVTMGPCIHMPDPSPTESAQTWAPIIQEYEKPLCLTVCTRQRLCSGLVVEVMLEKFDTYFDSDHDFVTPELHLHASVIKDFLEHATPEEIRQLACTFADAYLETEPCNEGSPCMQD